MRFDDRARPILEFCVFCGKRIPEHDRQLLVPHRYCSTRCAGRQQAAIRKLRSTSPPDARVA